MRMTVDKTRSVLERYNVTSESDRRDGAGRLDVEGTALQDRIRRG